MPARTVWSGEMDNQLRTLWTQGHSASEIGRHLGKTKNSVVGRAHRLDLDARPSPILDGTNSSRGVFVPRLASAIADKIKIMLANGMPTAAIASRVGVDFKTVERWRTIMGEARPVRWAPRVVQKPVFVAPVVVMQASPPRISLLTCEWLDGETPRTFVRCTHRAVPGMSWCSEHRKRVFARSREVAA